MNSRGHTVAGPQTAGESLHVASRRTFRLPRLVVLLAVVAGLGATAPGTSTAASTTAATTTAPAAASTATRTVTAPSRTDTVTETTTASAPEATTSGTNRTATVQLTPATATTEDQSGSSRLPGWGWALIGLGAVLIGLVMFLLGRRGGRPPSGPTGTPQPPAPREGAPG